MMPNFKPYNYNQSLMVVINYQDQLQAGTFEYALHYLIDNRIDLSIFYPRYKNDDTGWPAYDPAILLKIILFAGSDSQYLIEMNFSDGKRTGNLMPTNETDYTPRDYAKDYAHNAFEPTIINYSIYALPLKEGYSASIPKQRNANVLVKHQG